ncbi:MAG: hypothetical protein DLM64_10810 [Solirubrobacterales bacterium]|nr:MAG: hypothetical protein DLM64_10810 [Solirubrobacterales bacterium]
MPRRRGRRKRCGRSGAARRPGWRPRSGGARRRPGRHPAPGGAPRRRNRSRRPRRTRVASRR